MTWLLGMHSRPHGAFDFHRLDGAVTDGAAICIELGYAREWQPIETRIRFIEIISMESRLT